MARGSKKFKTDKKVTRGTYDTPVLTGHLSGHKEHGATNEQDGE